MTKVRTRNLQYSVLILNRYTTAQTGILTTKTDVLTASDTLCRSSAAVPGLLSPRVNLRVSAWLGADISNYKLSLISSRCVNKLIKTIQSIFSPLSRLQAHTFASARDIKILLKSPPLLQPLTLMFR